VVAIALASLPQVRVKENSGMDTVRRMVEFAEKRFIQLPAGERIRDLVHEGHRH
jgi:hypothetical protein